MVFSGDSILCIMTANLIGTTIVQSHLNYFYCSQNSKHEMMVNILETLRHAVGQGRSTD